MKDNFEAKVVKLINNNDWQTILDLFKQNKIDPYKKIIQGNTVCHVVFNKGIEPIINYLSQSEEEALCKLDSDGQTCLHILAKNANFDLLLQCFRNNPKLININNKQNRSVLFCLIKYNDTSIVDEIIVKIIKEFKNIDYKNLDINQQSIIHALIHFHTKTDNMLMLNLLEYVIKNYQIDLNYPSGNIPLIYATNKNNLSIVNALNIGFGGILSQGAFSFVTISGAGNLIQGAPTGIE